ncbi:Chromosome segregation protein smc [Coniochaeta hoffmannii]|uniref:Chromosome segregation protein smc n=1 Tax=Coniochaeta hoffmannii TaxID=91930 RepID=A0AA38REX4_9PEZI|nr:Chromosome segregation protein smc [Coniochaeta hoffmannii]
MFLKGLLGTLLPPAADPSPRSSTTSAKSRLGGFLHGRKNSRSTLTPASQDAVNSMPSPRPGVVKSSNSSSSSRQLLPSSTPTPTPPPPSPQILPGRMASIRAVGNSFDEPRDGGTTEEDSSSESHAASRSSAFSSSITSNASGISAMSQQSSSNGGADSEATVRLKPECPRETTTTAISLQVPSPAGNTATQRRSGEVNRSSFERSSFEIPQRDSSRTAVTTLATLANGRQPGAGGYSDLSPDGGDAQVLPTNGWDSTIGKAGLGKTGRVINKLVSDNEALKRDIKIERLRADEAKQTARLLEDKMDRMSSDYEGRLLEANVTKTLLARKERQVESLQAAVELERHKASSALERERMWKDELEKVRADAKQKVEEATNHAALMEGRYNAISSHWREQGEEVKRVVGTMKTEVDGLLEERRRDDEKISTLREVCDQQDGNIRELIRQKEEIARQFEAYKAEQEEALREIKRAAVMREEEQERVIGESREVLHKLRWALGVKENVKWAE